MALNFSAKVMQIRKKDTGRIYAMKSIRKGTDPCFAMMYACLMPSVPAATLASRPGEIPHILAERTVLALVRNPFIVPLKFSFQTADKLYLVMPFGLSLYLCCIPGPIHNFM
jgi:serum/glucocorticoid-regulated kinase 2